MALNLSRRTVLTAGFIAAASMLPLAASAQQATTNGSGGPSAGITATTDCKAFRPDKFLGDGDCEFAKGHLLEKQNACLAKLIEFKKANPVRFSQMGRITRDNACDAAARISANGGLTLGDGG